MQSSAPGTNHRKTDMLSALEELTVKLEDKTCLQGNKEKAKAQEQLLATGECGGPGERRAN